ncbi:hypothetical protein LCGC14_1032350 [marine sediment metagenome]|uniref:Uncharacterized protein n=1 Tax=marine sediment metagenome TaxID=412755 RepID=A0A0F9MYS1_9ZZZZ
MKQFGNLKGYQGDIKNKALVDYINWVLPLKEKIFDLAGNFWSHDAGEISRYFSNEVKQVFNEAEKSFTPFWSAYLKLEKALLNDLELTDRERSLWPLIWEYKEIQDKEYTWHKYATEFSEHHAILKNLTEEDNKFIDFWIHGYE